MRLLPASLFVALLAAGAGGQGPSNAKTATAKNSSAASPLDTVLVGAGDIASCDDLSGAQATAKLIDGISGTVFAVGDLAYPDGSDEQFRNCYGPTWGRFKDRTRPAPGNLEYHSDGASGYVRYFGATAGDPKKGYYSRELAAWHIIVLNSECAEVGGCGPGSALGVATA
jgi:acid phosphatase type 7